MFSINQKGKLKMRKWTQNLKHKLFDLQTSLKLKEWKKTNL